jgi:maltose/moltooligosaccharide transporter
MQTRPTLGFAQLWNISFGFFGIQIGFALQNANASRIFQSLGTPIDQLGLMWIAAPLTGLLVQPLIGHYSDRTWGRLGRRRPYFLIGAILCTCALFFMPNSPTILAAAITLWILDASLNVSMEPFRAFVGDMLSPRQRPAGYAFQTWFIGAGAVVASIAPYVLENVFGVSNTAPAGQVPDAVRYGFYFGGAMLLAAVLWTVLTVREYSPAELAAFGEETEEPIDTAPPVVPARGPLWIVGGGIVGARSLFRRGRHRAVWRGADGIGGAGAHRSRRQCAEPHHRRSRDHARHDAAAGAGAVLYLGGAHHHVGLYDAGDRAAGVGHGRSGVGWL